MDPKSDLLQVALQWLGTRGLLGLFLAGLRRAPFRRDRFHQFAAACASTHSGMRTRSGNSLSTWSLAQTGKPALRMEPVINSTSHSGKPGLTYVVFNGMVGEMTSASPPRPHVLHLCAQVPPTVSLRSGNL